MTGYRIGKVHYKNFGPFEDVTFNFDQPGLTVIEGHIEGKRGCDSNGAGKSFLFDGTAWALFGRCIRERYKGDNVIRLGSKGGCSVEVRIVGGPSKIKIVRHRKHPVNASHVYLYVDGKNKSRGTDPATTLAIEQMLGMDFTSFCNSVAFGVREDVKTFFSATDVDRKKVLERILGLERYARAERVARQRIKPLAEKTQQLELQRVTLQAGLAEKQALLDELNAVEQVDDLDFQVSLLRLRARRQQDKALRLEHAIAKVALEIAAEEAKNEAAHAAWAVKHDEYMKQLAQLNRDRTSLQHEAGRLKGERATQKAKIKKFKKLAGKKCPECEQVLTPNCAEAFREDYEKALKNFEADLKAMEFKVEIVDDEIAKLNAPVEPHIPQDWSVLQEEKQGYVELRQEAEKQAAVHTARAQEMQEVHERVMLQVGTLSAEIEKTRVGLDAVEEEYVGVKKLSVDLEFWVEGFGNQGLKSFLIEAEIPQVNTMASTYVQQLLGVGATVKLSATKTLKTKDVVREKLTVEGSIPECTESYAGASKGQKKRMDLALLLAFRQLVSTRSARAFPQLFVDEIFDGMDRTGAESIGELIRGIADGCPVALVTHDSRIKPAADRVVVVHHSNGMASLKAPESKGVKLKKKSKKAKKRRSSHK
jgi:DNA repair exonuclease SbcCD ATPase subunit